MSIRAVDHERVFAVKNMRSIMRLTRLGTVLSVTVADNGAAGAPGDEAVDVDVPDSVLRSALEFAVGIAAAGTKVRPALPAPAELKRFHRFHKLPGTALAQVRAAVANDPEFRQRLGSVATDELVDPIGVLWLSRPDGWRQAIADLVPAETADDDAAARREERRRHAAQEAAARAHAEALTTAAELERERAARQAALAESEQLRRELQDVRQRLRDAQRAEHSAAQALAKAEAALREAQQRPAPEPAVVQAPSVDLAGLRTLAARAGTASTDLARMIEGIAGLLADDGPPNAAAAASALAPRRTALRLPGGVLAGSAEATEFLLRAPNARVMVDGYNVAKLGWPKLDLDHQRERCIAAAENLAVRWNLDLTVVFDGADVAGAHAVARRRVRVVFSPAGVLADDVIRAEVAGVDAEQPVVVVTNDRAVIADVRAAGANTVSSEAFLAL